MLQVGLKRSMPCVDLNSLVDDERFSLRQLEQDALSLLIDSERPMFIDSSSSKRQRTKSKRSINYEFDIMLSPATAALEESIAKTNASIDQLELSLHLAAYFGGSSSTASDFWEMSDYCFDSSSSGGISKMSSGSTRMLSRGHRSCHLGQVTCALSRLSTMSA